MMKLHSLYWSGLMVGVLTVVGGSGVPASAADVTPPVEATDVDTASPETESPATDSSETEPAEPESLETETPETEPTEATSAPDPADYATYTLPDYFSIQYPEDWQAAAPDGETEAPTAIITSPEAQTEGDFRAATEVTWLSAPPEEIVPAALKSLQDREAEVVRYRAINIDNTTALQIWLANEEGDLPYALMTYIGYDGTTAVIVSHHSAPLAESTLMAMHQSFRRLADNPETLPSDNNTEMPSVQ